jgi:enoyl-CoA hydratase
LVNHVFPIDSYFAEAVKLATKIAEMPRVAVRLIKDAVNHAEELPLSAGLAYEKQGFLVSFGTEDKTEGMTAFVEKRKPSWKHR